MSVIEDLRKLHQEEDLENFFHGYVDLARTERLRQLFVALPALLDIAEALEKIATVEQRPEMWSLQHIIACASAALDKLKAP